MDVRIDRLFLLMRSESNRLKTFQMEPAWPKDQIDVMKLAKAGFFYLFKNDQVCCAFCHGQLSQWDTPNEDPMTRHVKSFICCPFIMGAEVGNEPLGEDPLPGPKRPGSFDVFGFHNSPAPFQQQQSSYSSSDESESEYQISTFQPDIFNCSATGSPQNLDLSLSQSSQESIPIENSLYSSQPYDESPMNSQQKYTPNSASINGNASTKHMHASDGICKVCYRNPIELIFLPCRHSVSCQSCAQRLDECPYCKATIITRIRIYLF